MSGTIPTMEQIDELHRKIAPSQAAYDLLHTHCVIVADIAKGFNQLDARGTFLLHKELGIGPRLVERSTVGRQMYDTLPYQAIGARIVAETKAEEMRVLYVAMTRAREKLILTGTLAASKWEKQAARYARSLDSRELALPDDMIRGAPY